MQSTSATFSSAATGAAADPAERESAGWSAPLALAALIFAVYLMISFCSTIWDRDEARFSRATAEMVSTGNYLYPTYNGKLRPDKPILIYWLMSVPVRLFGSSEWAYRLCSVFGTTLACLFTYTIGRRLFSHTTGLWGMALLAVNPLMTYTGAVATSDAVLLAFITGSFAVFADALVSRLSAKHVAAWVVLFSGGMLTKGPVSLLPVIPIILTLVLLRREAGNPWPSIIKTIGAALASLTVFLLWFYPANNATHNDLYDQMFMHHLVERMGRPLEHHGGNLFFYPLVIIVGFFPWTLYLPGALIRLTGAKSDDSESGFLKWVAAKLTMFLPLARIWYAISSAVFGVWGRLSRGEGTQRPGRALLASWIATFLVVMVAISTKLPHYILPIWPALALGIGAYLEATSPEDAPSAGAFWTFLGGCFFLIVALGVAAAMGFGPEYLSGRLGDWLSKPSEMIGLGPKPGIFNPKNPVPEWLQYADESRTARSVFGALTLIVALPIIFRHTVAHFAANARVLLAASLLTLLLTGSFLLPGFERIKISAELAKQLHAHVGDDVPITVCGYNEASLIFYLQRNVEDIIPDRSTTNGVKAGDPKNTPRLDSQAAAKLVEQAVVDWAKVRGPGVLIIPRKMYEKIKMTGRLPELDVVGEVKNGFNYSKGHWVDVLALRREN